MYICIINVQYVYLYNKCTMYIYIINVKYIYIYIVNVQYTRVLQKVSALFFL
jgi:hypothetical protein